ncbi:hypothetical protein AAE02nite_50330 [Adhaeribacter aerolatus]|uniref:Uncharacterized protein n=1 Tax=Adhaeribacter aerolatus TaxID=670289 RepID=A0A512B5X8_9BACT|nr:hypothetical protein [Adhaeribacter aerolatus]GEO07369.1 hypothetical protein AAE02nite_50330 [Adhaeribacter aerolatus]
MNIIKPEIPRLDIKYDELKSIVIEKIQNTTSFQFTSLVTAIAAYVNKESIGFVKQSNTTYENKLNQSDEGLIREVIWDLIIQRILTIGDFYNHDWPYLSVTEYGQKVLKSTEVIPHDPAKYIERVKKQIPNIDNIIIIYLSESINTYNINQLLSSTIALGCASGKALLLLIDAYERTFYNQQGSERFKQKVKNRMIKIQFEEFQKDFKRIVGSLPKELIDNYENILLGVFEMFRNQRNSAGHPVGHFVDKEMIFANLQVFITYCKRIYELIAYLEANKHD